MEAELSTSSLVNPAPDFSYILNGLRFSCGPKPAARQMNFFLWLTARQLQAPG
jgi:hypothetical protein